MKLENSKYLWAKKSGEERTWLPLFVHLADTGNIMGIMWNLWLSQSMKNFLLQNIFTYEDRDFLKKEKDEIDEDVARRFCIFLGAIHDLGKATPVFQMKSSHGDLGFDEEIKSQIIKGGMDPIDLEKIYIDSYKSPHAFASEQLLEKYGLHKNIAMIPASHHGAPPSNDAYYKNKMGAYPKHYKGQSQTGKWEKAQKELFDFALGISGFSSMEDIPVPNQPAQVVLSGLLVMADWIASNENLFPYFPWDNPESGPLNQDILFSRAYDAWDQLQLPDPWYAANDWRKESLYPLRFDVFEKKLKPFPMQTKVEEIAKKIDRPGMLIIEAAMGQGKTEAALVAAEIFAQKSGASGIFFALPTQATSDGLFPRIIDWMEALDEEGHSIRLAHGKAQFNKEYSRLLEGSRQIEIDGQEHSDGEKISVHQWFEGSKKSLLDHFVVGTIDQLLLASLKQKHFMLRHLGLANKVVIIDECHAFDAFMNVYLERTLEWLGSYNVPVILLSATLPANTRNKVLEAYYRGCSGRSRGMEYKDEGVGAYAYPRITYTEGIYFCADTIEDTTRKKDVVIEKISGSELRDYLFEQLQEGGCIGIIANTVRHAQDIFRELAEAFGAEEMRLLHSNFLATDRSRKERELLFELGNKQDSKRPYRRIVIGTQIFEQSFNVDFDQLITELCPMDLLIQRIGRLQRFDLERPDSFKQAKCIILHPDGKDWSEGTAAIYDEYLLARTKNLIPETIKLPDDISRLVQHVYDSSMELDIEIDGYDKMKGKYWGKIQSKEQRADSFRIQKPLTDEVEYDLIGMLDKREELDDIRAEAKVRDSDPSIEVLMVQVDVNGDLLFQFEDRHYRIFYGMIPDDETAKALACQRIRLPRALCTYLLESTIRELEELNKKDFGQLQQSKWLKGELILPFSLEGTTTLNGWELRYDETYGLRYKKEEDNGKGI